MDKNRLLTGLNNIEKEELLEEFRIEASNYFKHHTLRGEKRAVICSKERPNSLFGNKIKLDFMLMYLKENPNQAYHAYVFRMSQSKVSEWVKVLLPILERSINKLGVMPEYGDEFSVQKNEDLLIDVTERQVPRKTDNESQKEEYSGKKKLHTIKNLAVTDKNRFIKFITPSYQGSTHDKSIWNDINFDFGKAKIYVDLGFKGVEKLYEYIVIPHKKFRKSELNSSQKQENNLMSKIRVKVEHAFAGVKSWKIIRNKIRIKSFEKRDLVFKIAVGLHNLRVRNNCLIQNQS